MTRKDYLAKNCTHREYYAQFVTEGLKQQVASRIGEKRLKESKDPYFNDIPLREWDRLGLPMLIVDRLKRAGDGYSLAGAVCIHKEAARQIVIEIKS